MQSLLFRKLHFLRVFIDDVLITRRRRRDAADESGSREGVDGVGQQPKLLLKRLHSTCQCWQVNGLLGRGSLAWLARTRRWGATAIAPSPASRGRIRTIAHRFRLRCAQRSWRRDVGECLVSLWFLRRGRLRGHRLRLARRCRRGHGGRWWSRKRRLCRQFRSRRRSRRLPARN